MLAPNPSQHLESQSVSQRNSNCQIVGCLFRRDSPRGASSGRADGRRPPRRRSARDHIGRSALRRMDRRAEGARKWPRPFPLAHRAASGGLGAAQGTVRDSSAFRTNRLAGRSLPARSVPTLSSPRHNLPPSEGPLKVAATRCMRRSCVELLESCNDTERLRVIPRHQCASLRRGDARRHVALRTNIRYGSALNRFKKSRPPPQPLLSANSTDRRHAASVTWSQPGSRQAENA